MNRLLTFIIFGSSLSACSSVLPRYKNLEAEPTSPNGVLNLGRENELELKPTGFEEVTIWGDESAEGIQMNVVPRTSSKSLESRWSELADNPIKLDEKLRTVLAKIFSQRYVKSAIFVEWKGEKGKVLAKDRLWADRIEAEIHGPADKVMKVSYSFSWKSGDKPESTLTFDLSEFRPAYFSQPEIKEIMETLTGITFPDSTVNHVFQILRVRSEHSIFSIGVPKSNEEAQSVDPASLEYTEGIFKRKKQTYDSQTKLYWTPFWEIQGASGVCVSTPEGKSVNFEAMPFWFDDSLRLTLTWYKSPDDVFDLEPEPLKKILSDLIQFTPNSSVLVLIRQFVASSESSGSQRLDIPTTIDARIQQLIQTNNKIQAD